jgi:hypothetical protein
VALQTSDGSKCQVCGPRPGLRTQRDGRETRLDSRYVSPGDVTVKSFAAERSPSRLASATIAGSAVCSGARARLECKETRQITSCLGWATPGALAQYRQNLWLVNCLRLRFMTRVCFVSVTATACIGRAGAIRTVARY